MEHRFSKREYFFCCAFTMFFTGFVAASYFDISTCPYRYDRGVLINVTTTKTLVAGDVASSPFTEKQKEGGGRDVKVVENPRSLFTSLAQDGGLTCHMADLVIWVYITALLLLISYKYYHYRMQGLHYFFLDYCYFHNACLVAFLLWCLVDVQWSREPFLSWERYLPKEWQEEREIILNTGFQNGTEITRSLAELALKRRPLVNQTWTLWVMEFIPSTARQMLLVAGVYKPISIDIITIGYAAAEVSTTEVLLLHFLSFFTLTAGSFGPILGAILMWRNALLFHSFDRMSSSYLHLAPAVTQLLLLHRLFTTARGELSSILRISQNDNGNIGLYVDSLCGKETFCYELREAVSYWTLIKLHFAMFIAWQIYYHAFYEGLRRRRQMLYKKKMRELVLQQNEFCRLTGATAEEAELVRPIIILSEGVVGDPTHRVTAYSWLMENPPLGKNGVFYRIVTIFGTGYVPTMVLFQITQWFVHMFFFTLAYPFMYYSFHVSLSAGPLALYVIIFCFICVYNAAAVNKGWIRKLQHLAKIGMETQRKINSNT